MVEMPPSDASKKTQKRGLGTGRSDIPDFIPSRGVIGRQIRQWREKSGTSLVELEARSGVSDSEISRVEQGSQSFRLESFIRICAALGLPAGYALEHAVVFNPEPFEGKIKSHPLTPAICNNNKAVEDVFVKGMAGFAAFAAQLVSCSRPKDKASIVRYPDHQIEQRFIDFGYYLETSLPPEKRLSILLDLKKRPMDTLMGLRLISESLLRELVSPLFDHRTISPSMQKFAMAIFPIDPEKPIQSESAEAERTLKNDLHLTVGSLKSNTMDVKSEIDKLIERVKHKASKPGAKAELARMLDVDPARVSEWLSGKKEPGGEYTLRLLKWVGQA